MNSDNLINENEINDELIINEINNLSNYNNDSENPSNGAGHLYLCIESLKTVYDFWWNNATAKSCYYGGQSYESSEWMSGTGGYENNYLHITYQYGRRGAYTYIVQIGFDPTGRNLWLPYYFTNTSIWYPTTAGTLGESTSVTTEATSSAVNGIRHVVFTTDTGHWALWNVDWGSQRYTFDTKPLGGSAHIIDMRTNNGTFVFNFVDKWKNLSYSDCRYLILPRRYSYSVKIPSMESNRCFAHWNSNGTIKRQIINKDTVMLTINSSTAEGHDTYILGSSKYDFFGAICSNNATSAKMNDLIYANKDDGARFDIQIKNSSGTWCWTTGSYVNYLDDGTTWTTYPESLRGTNRTAETTYCSTFFSDFWKNDTEAFQNLLDSGYHIAWTSDDTIAKQFVCLGATIKATITNNSGYAVDSAALDLNSYMNSSIGDFTAQHDSNPGHYFIRPCCKLQNSASKNIEIYGSNGSINSSSITKGNWAWAPANDNSYYIVIKNNENTAQIIGISYDGGNSYTIPPITIPANSTYNCSVVKFTANQNIIIKEISNLNRRFYITGGTEAISDISINYQFNEFYIKNSESTSTFKYVDGNGIYTGMYWTPNNKINDEPILAYDLNNIGLCVKENPDRATAGWKKIMNDFHVGVPFEFYGPPTTAYEYFCFPAGIHSNGNIDLFKEYSTSTQMCKIAGWNPNSDSTALIGNIAVYRVAIPCAKVVNTCDDENVLIYLCNSRNPIPINSGGYNIPAGYDLVLHIKNNTTYKKCISISSTSQSYIIYLNPGEEYDGTITPKNISETLTFFSYNVSTNKIRVNGEWKDAQAKIYVSGAWKDCTAYVWKDGVWHKTY